MRCTVTNFCRTSDTSTRVNTSSSASPKPTRKSPSRWWFTVTPPQSHRYGAEPDPAHSLASSRAEPTPSVQP